jgi:tetratricopeptide (TPR) repeat protein
MSKIVLSAVLAAWVLAGGAAEAQRVAAKITVGSKTSDGHILSRNKDLITFRVIGMGGDVSYPVDAVKEVVFPVKVDQRVVANLMENRMHEQLAATLEAALKPFEAYSDLPSNIAQYQGVLMELYYKAGDYTKSMNYASKLLADDRDPEMQHKAIVYQGLSLLGSDRLPEAEALFAEQGWTGELKEDATAEDLYITARFQYLKKDYTKAIETAARIIAFHSQDPDWMRPTELLCAQIYMELARTQKNPAFLDSADEVIREIALLYRDTDEADQAAALKLKVDTLRIEMEAELEDGDAI